MTHASTVADALRHRVHLVVHQPFDGIPQQIPQQAGILKGEVHPLAGEGQQGVGRIAEQGDVGNHQPGGRVEVERTPVVGNRALGAGDHLPQPQRKPPQQALQKGQRPRGVGPAMTHRVELHEPDEPAAGHGK
jgi:hypothetical protein